MFEQTVMKSVSWVDEVAEGLHVDRDLACRALRAVLHVFRDRLPPAEAANLAAQLPTLLRGLYYEGWRPNARGPRVTKPDEVLALVAAALSRPPTETEAVYADEAVDVVLRVLARHVARGEMDDVRQCLPEAVQSLWPRPESEN